jgi:anti-sigma-K factor RskA
MTEHLTPEERTSLAAEYALGLLVGDDLRQARHLARTDPAFRAEVERWTGRLAPMLDDVREVSPPQRLWTRVDAALGSTRSDSNVVALRRRINVWRGATAAMSAVAAALAIVVVTRVAPPVTVAPTPSRQVAAAPLVAMLGNDQKQVKLVASWDPGQRQLVLAVSGDMPSDPAHSHELWVIPSNGKPQSLGVMPKGSMMHMRLEQALADLLRRGAVIAVSVEPRGGSPTGAPTGPVAASGKLETA